MNIDWRYLLRIGLIAGGVTVYTALVGMIETFSARQVFVDAFTLGEVLILAASIIAGFIVTRKLQAEHGALAGLLAGVVVGFISSLPSLGLLFLSNAINMRPVLVSVSPGLIALLAWGQESLAAGALYLAGMLTVSGLAGSVLASIPGRPRRALISALVVALLAGLMSELLRQVLIQVLDREGMRQIFRSNTLRQGPAIYIFAVTFVLSLIWSYSGAPVRKRLDGLAPRQQLHLRRGSYGLLGIVLLMLPWALGTYLSEVMSNVGLYVLMGLGLNIAVGWAGLLDLGYVTNFAVGAYVMAVLTTTGPQGMQARAGIDPFTFWMVLPVSILAAMMTGFILALPVLRMRGDYLAIATLGFGEIIRLLALSDWLRPLIGGAQGILFIPKPKLFELIEFTGPQQLYYIIFAGCLVMLFVAQRLNNSRTGRQWMAMREDEQAASAMGIDIVKTKLLAFTLSAASGGMAGAIFAVKVGTIFPHSFSLLVSINTLSLIIVGGIGSIPGVVLGAIVLIGLPELLREFAEFRLLLYGALLVVMMLMRPAGLWPSPVTRRELRDALEESSPLAERI